MTVLSQRRVALTTDLWMSVAGQGYMTVTGHYLTKDWTLECKVLATRVLKDQHTGNNLATAIHDIRAKFKITDVVAVTTDNAANMRVMAKVGQLKRVPCFSHTLQLAINDGLKTDRLQRSLGACRRLVSELLNFILHMTCVQVFVQV